MQYINLLPQEMRPKETTPIKVIVTLYIGVAVCFSLLMWGLLLQFGEVRQKQQEIVNLDKRIKALKPDADLYDRIQNEIRELERRDNIVSQIEVERVKWGRKLDLVWDVVSSSDTSWVRDVKLQGTTFKVKKRGTRKGVDAKLPTLTLEMYSSNFNKDGKILDMTSESLIEEFIERYRSNEELNRGFELIHPNVWIHSDKSWKSKGQLVIRYDLIMKAYPFDKEKGFRKKYIE